MFGKFRLGSMVLTIALCTLGTTVDAGLTVGYYTDGNTTDTGPLNIITETGATAVQITTLASFNLSSINVLMLDESSNSGPSSDFTASLPALLAFVQAGGKLMVHDRSVGAAGSTSPFLLGYPSISVTRDTTSDIDVVATTSTTVTNGPFGTITNTTLDGGNYSAHGYASLATLPTGTTNILSIGGQPTESVAFDYALGKGFVYYSTIPLDYYLDGETPAAFSSIYAPNALSYVEKLAPPSVVPEPGSVVLLGVGLACLGGLGLRRRKVKAIA